MDARRVTIVTSGHPSTCPRMVKAADAAAQAGYDVRVVSVDYIDWATRLDRDLTPRRSWRWRPVMLKRTDRPLASRVASARHRCARALSGAIDPRRTPRYFLLRACGRTHPEIVRAILEEPFDFVYGGTVGALGATAEAARRAGRRFALDFEDYHPAESESADAALTHAVIARVVTEVANDAAFTTAASKPMADEYARRFGLRPLVIHNVVPRATAPAIHAHDGPLRLYWFSQIIGPRRGLEDVVRGVALAGIAAELHLRGTAREEYVEELRARAQAERAQLAIVVHAPTAPDAMVAGCAPFDIGLSLEQEGVLNRALCLPNKPLTYLAAGLAVVATDTPGQRLLQEPAGEGIWWYRPGDAARLGEGLRRWHADRDLLVRSRRCSYAAAQQRFHWEHPLERGTLLHALEGAMS